MSETFSHMLVPYNGTSGSQKAFKEAVALAQLTKSRITIITCLEERSTLGLFKTKENKKNFENENRLAMEEHAKLKKYAEEHDVPTSYKIIKTDTAAHAILEFAEKITSI